MPADDRQGLLPLDAPPVEPTPKIYAVGELVQMASRRLEREFSHVWVEGEVSNLRKPSSGHLYMTLKDERAQISVVIFRSTARRIAFDVEDGQVLRVAGRVAIYEPQGRFQLTASQVEPAGIGALQLAMEQLRRKLEAEGLFAPARKKALPPLPRRIAVVTSSTGAAIRDVLRVLERRVPLQVVVCPSAVQGEGAPLELVAALRRADALGVDIIILTRGGGSLEDLQPFNDERVARQIASCATPVVSGVGHEIDVTIADLVADKRAATPSAAAELVAPTLVEVKQRLDNERARLERAIAYALRRFALQLARAQQGLGAPRARVDRGRQLVDELMARAQRAMTRSVTQRRETLAKARVGLERGRPSARLERNRSALSKAEGRMETAIKSHLSRRRARFGGVVATLQALSPLAVLFRGYSVVRALSGRVVSGAEQVELEEQLEVRLHRGALTCRVEGRAIVEDDP